jgi:hypothetical protein
MRRPIAALLLAAPLIAATAFAQERIGPGRIEIGVFPVGGVFFAGDSSAPEPAFGNFALGATLTYNINGWIGVEGEFGNAIGVRQNLQAGDAVALTARSPGLYTYTATLIVSPFTVNRSLAPYATVGAGGITLLDGAHGTTLGLEGNTSYFAGNVGGGLKWYFNDRLGVRADYRLLVVNGRSDAPEFFGRDTTRVGHRVYGGLLIAY